MQGKDTTKTTFDRTCYSKTFSKLLQNMVLQTVQFLFKDLVKQVGAETGFARIRSYFRAIQN